MKTLSGNPNLKYLYLGGLGLLILGVTGGTCTKDVNSQIVVSVDVTAPFHAHGLINEFSDTSSVDLGAKVNLPQVLADNGIQSIKEIDVESVFYDVTVPDPEPTRTVTGDHMTVQLNQSQPGELFQVTSVLIDDPAIQDPNWGTAPLEQAGVTVINTALAELVNNTGDPRLTFEVSGVSTPSNVNTDFTWQVRVRLKVVGVRKVTVISP